MKNTLKIIEQFCNEVNLNFKEDGIYIRQLDLANVCMFDVFIPLKNNINKKVIVNTKEFIGLIKDNKELFIKDNFLCVKNKKIPIIDTDFKDEKLPNVDLKAKIHINNMDKFKHSINKLTFESVILSCSKDSLYIEDEHEKILIEKDTFLEKSVYTDENKNTKYSLEYLKNFVKYLNFKNGILYFDNDILLKIACQNVNGIRLYFLLAPRVKNE